MKDNNLVSIIIPVYNSEKTIEKCLESIKNQTYNNIEVIVVDKYSKDETIKIAKRFTEKVFVINVNERNAQRNFGILNAKGKYLCIIDSDMELLPYVIEKCVEKQMETLCSGIIIPEKTICNNFLGSIREHERSFYYNNNLMGDARFFIKDDVIRVGMYDEEITGQEDWDLPIRMAKMGMIVDKEINCFVHHHEENISLSNQLKKRYYYMLTSHLYIKRHKDLACKQFSPIYRLSIFLKDKRFYSKPLLALGVLFLKFLEYFSGGLGYLAGRFSRK